MAIRKSFAETKSAEREATFASTYKLKLKEGMEKYVIFLGLDQGIFQTPKHHVAPKGTESFKNRGKYGVDILCKSYDEEGNFVEEAECCRLQKEMAAKYPDKDDASKRIISGMSWKIHIPVLVLGTSELDPSAKKIPVQKLSIKTYQFSYLEMSMSTWTAEKAKLAEQLEISGQLEYDLEPEEKNKALLDYISHSVVKITAIHSDKGLAYEKMFNFIPFSNQKIGEATDEYKYITQYDRLKKLNNDLVNYMTLFAAEVDNLVCSDWKPSELTAFVENPSNAEKANKEVQEKVKKAEKAINESDEDVVLGEEEIPFDQDEVKEEIEVSQEDATYSVDENLDEFFV